MKPEFFQQIFEKYFSISCHKNGSNGSWIVPDRWADMMKLIVAFPNFANTPKY